MRWRQKIKKYTILSLLLVTFIMSIDFADAKKGKWKPGNENHRRYPIDRILQNYGRIPTGKTIQNYRRIPTGKVIPNDRKLEIDGKMQNDRRIPIGKTSQTDRRIPTSKSIQNDRIMLFNRRLNSGGITDGIMQKEGRDRINKILENDRISKDELQKKIDRLSQNKIDRLSQNKNIQIDDRVQDDRIMLNVRMQNDTKTQNDSKVQNNRRIFNERYQEIINDHRIWVATTHRTALQWRDWGSPTEPTSSESPNGSVYFNSTRSGRKNIFYNPEGGIWEDFTTKLKKGLKEVHYSRPDTHRWLIVRTCHLVTSTYISALEDYKKFIPTRYFYENNLEYEVGYLVGEIVSKYQRMLELYDLATEYFYKNQVKQYAPTPYVLYVYTNVLEMGTVLTHLCNMLNELEDKYAFIPVNQSGFSDYHLQKKAKPGKTEKEGAPGGPAYEKMLLNFQKAKLKAIKKKRRVKDISLDMTVTPPDRRPKHEYKHFPLVYGWSIEEDW